MQGSSYAHRVLFYGVVGAQTEKMVEFFLERERAEPMIGEGSGGLAGTGSRPSEL